MAETYATQPQEIGVGDGHALVGSKVSKKFGRKLYTGSVHAFQPDTNWYKVVYEDGDNEELEWQELEPILEKPGAKGKKRPTTASTPKSRKSRKRKQENTENQPPVPEPADRIDLNEAVQDVDLEEQAPDGEVVEAEDTEGIVDEVDELFEMIDNVQVMQEEAKTPGTRTGTKGKSGSRKRSASTKGKAASRKGKRKMNSSAQESQVMPQGKKAKLSKGTRKSPKKAAQKTPSSREVKGKAIQEQPSEDEAEAKFSPTDRGSKLKGRKLRKDFDGELFTGKVTGYDRKNRYYKIHYEDGDEEELEWWELEPLLLPLDEQKLPSSSAGPAQEQPVVKRTTVKVTKTKVVLKQHKRITRANTPTRTRKRG